MHKAIENGFAIGVVAPFTAVGIVLMFSGLEGLAVNNDLLSQDTLSWMHVSTLGLHTENPVLTQAILGVSFAAIGALMGVRLLSHDKHNHKH